MNQNLKNFLLFISSLIISGVLSMPFGKLYEWIIGRPSEGGFWGPDPLLTNGFVFALFIFFPLLLSFGGKNKFYYIISVVVIFILLFWGYWEGLYILAVLFLPALIIGLLLNWAYLKLVKKT